MVQFNGISNVIYEVHKNLGKFNVMITDNGSNFLKAFRVFDPNELFKDPDNSQDGHKELTGIPIKKK